jgi:hypothetical protein
MAAYQVEGSASEHRRGDSVLDTLCRLSAGPAPVPPVERGRRDGTGQREVDREELEPGRGAEHQHPDDPDQVRQDQARHEPADDAQDRYADRPHAEVSSSRPAAGSPE